MSVLIARPHVQRVPPSMHQHCAFDEFLTRIARLSDKKLGRATKMSVTHWSM